MGIRDVERVSTQVIHRRLASGMRPKAWYTQNLWFSHKRREPVSQALGR